MEVIQSLHLTCKPIFGALLTLVALNVFFIVMYKWARKQKGMALAFGMFVQMFLPDPKVQQTIEAVSKAKEQEQLKPLQAQKNNLKNNPKRNE